MNRSLFNLDTDTLNRVEFALKLRCFRAFVNRVEFILGLHGQCLIGHLLFGLQRRRSVTLNRV